MTANSHGSYGPPALYHGPPMSPADRLAFELENARSKTGLVGSLVHRYREANATAAIDATTKKNEAVTRAVKSATAATEAYRENQTVTLRSHIESELLPLAYQTAREVALLELQAQLGRAQEKQFLTQRDVLSAEVSRDSVPAMRALNLELGARKKHSKIAAAEAEIAEMQEVMPQAEATPKSAGNTMTLAEALRHRAELRADGKSTLWLDDKINELAARGDFEITE